MSGLSRLRALLLVAAAASAHAACLGLAEDRFSLAGTITVAPHLQKRAEVPNTMLFVVASNAAGVPIAVRRIINPQFPVAYQIKGEDLVLPGPVWQGKLSVKVYVNTHGKAGLVQRGDLTGAHRGNVYSGERSVDIVIDKEV